MLYLSKPELWQRQPGLKDEHGAAQQVAFKVLQVNETPGLEMPSEEYVSVLWVNKEETTMPSVSVP